MTRAPWVMLKPARPRDRAPSVVDTTAGWRFTNPRMPKDRTISLGETAERVASRYGIARREQDEFAGEEAEC